VNEETVLLVGFVIIAVAIGRGMASPYTAWADGHIDVSHLHNFPGADPCLIVWFQRIKSILSSAREDHTQAVTARIDSVNQLKEVVPLTEQLYAVAKETNSLEHENFLLQQEQAVKSELKAVLDSWVRYEQQQREAEQAALVQSVRDSVEAELSKPAFRRQLLEEALGQVERESGRTGWGGCCGWLLIWAELSRNKAV